MNRPAAKATRSSTKKHPPACDERTARRKSCPAPGSDQGGWAMEMEHGEHEDYARKPISVAEMVLRLNALLIHSGRFVPDITGGGGMSMGQGGHSVAATLAGLGKVICVFGAHG